MDSNNFSLNQEGELLLKELYNSKEVDFKKTSELLSKFRLLTREKVLNDELLDEKCLTFLVDCSAISHTEAQKCISNLILNYNGLRERLVKPYIEIVEKRFKSVIKEPQELFENVSNRDENYQVLYYDLRIIFLLSALCNPERELISDKLLSPVLELLSIECQDFTVENFLFVIEALKTLFNLTINKRCNSTLAKNSINELFSYVIKIGVNSNGASVNSEQLLVSLIHLLTNMPKEVYEELSDDSCDKTLDYLDNILSYEFDENFRETILPVLNVCANICKYNERVRSIWFKDIIESTKEFDKRPEEYDNLKGRLVQLMTSVDVHVKDIAAEFLYALCGSDAEKLITYTGFGNSAAFLTSRGLLSGQSRSDSNKMENTEYEELKTKINPITGKVEEPKKNPMEGMSEEEKEYHAHELATAITKLTNLGVMKPMHVNEEGIITELQPNTTKEKED